MYVCIAQCVWNYKACEGYNKLCKIVINDDYNEWQIILQDANSYERDVLFYRLRLVLIKLSYVYVKT